MNSKMSFFADLQAAYDAAFLSQNSDFITPGVITLVIIISVGFAVLHEKIIEPAWVRYHYTKHRALPSEKEVFWYRLSIMAMIVLLTGLAMLVLHWPS